MFLSNGQVVAAGSASVLGDRTPIFADQNYYGTSVLALLNQYAAYAAIYKSQLWVGTVVRKLAMATARMPFEVKRRINATDSNLEGGPMSALLARPNPEMSGFKLWEWTSSTRDVYGEAFWLKLRSDDGQVRELHPMHPTNVIVRRQPDGTLGYIYSNGAANVSDLPVIPARDVVAFTTYNPDNLTRGLSILEGLRMTLLNEDAARRATASMWSKGARPGMLLTTDQSLSEGAVKRMRAQSDALHAGADNAGSTMVLEEGLKAQVVQLSAEEMQYIQSRKLNREEVCAAYDVPPPVVHILDHATFSNITEQLRSQYRDTMAPRFVNFESVIDHQLVPDFYPGRDVFTRFNMEDVLRGDFEVKAQSTTLLRQGGIATGNEIRGMFGLARSADPEMDRVMANAALVPLGTPAERITITEGAPADPNQAAEAQNVIDAGHQAAADQAQGAPRAGKPGDLLPVAPKPLPAGGSGPTARGLSARQWSGVVGERKMHGATVKTWRTVPACDRHKGVDGEAVLLNDVFSHGYRVPGQDLDCGCGLTFDQE